MREDTKILLVDDTDSDRQLFSVALRGIGYSQIKTAVDGPQTLDLAREYLPRLVLMDTNMPGPNGYEVCGQMRQEGHEHTAIMGMSDSDDPKIKDLWYENGSDDFVDKGIFNSKESRADLHARIQAALKLRTPGHLEATRQIVEEELKAYQQEHGEESGLIYYLNNFPGILPSDQDSMDNYRAISQTIGVGDIPHGQKETASDTSDLYRKQTPREFFATIDRALKRLGIPIEDVKRLQYLRSNAAEHVQHKQELNELILPAYVQLRAIGYNPIDLTR